MGVVLSRFRRKLTSLEELEKIEEKIQDLEKYRNETEQRQKKVVGKFLIYSVGVYVLAAAVFYFLFFPASLRDRLFYIIPLLVFPIIVILVKKLISWYYAKRVTEQQDVLRRLRSDKRQLLERVMENETYKVARTILEKFAPDQLRNNNKLAIAGSNNTPTSNLRREQATIKAPPTTTNSSSTTTAIVPAVNSSVAPRTLTVNLPSAPGTELRHRTISTPQMKQILPQGASVQALQPAVPRARPILPKESGFMDRLIESIVGDGPSWRYALICAQCHGHNGMALREEFPFLAFHCCYCSYFNQAKKQRPLSPRLLDKDEGEEMQRPPDGSSDSEPDSEAHTSENEDAQPDESKDCHRESADEMGVLKVTESQHKSSDQENNQVSESSKKDAARVD